MVSKKSTPNNLLPSLVSSLSLLGNSTTKIFNAQTGICTLAALFRGYPKFCTSKHQSDVIKPEGTEPPVIAMRTEWNRTGSIVIVMQTEWNRNGSTFSLFICKIPGIPKMIFAQ